MATAEGLKPLNSGATIPVDPNVRIPDRVTRAAEQAEAAYKAAYTSPPGPTSSPDENTNAPAPAAVEPPQTSKMEVNQAVQPPIQEVSKPPPAVPPAPEENLPAEEWRHRYLSMKGRFDAATKSLGAMEHQMGELGQELMRTQNLVAELRASPPMPTSQDIRTPQADHNNVISQEDRATYGDELIDLTSRVARAALTPELERLKAENAQLTRQVKGSAKRGLFQALDARLPQWRQINDDVRFKTWCRLPNIYTGTVRQEMLKAAVDGANAPLVLQFFYDFLRETDAAGQTAPAPQVEQQIAPRTAAVSLESLASPGRARPAPGDSQVPAEKPIYSRAQISEFFDQKRRGLWDNRPAEVTAIEADLGLAQREGRIR